MPRAATNVALAYDGFLKDIYGTRITKYALWIIGHYATDVNPRIS
jgi:5-methylcytosine-specific restriction endonuclease McrBC regulatory subunit McrC